MHSDDSTFSAYIKFLTVREELVMQPHYSIYLYIWNTPDYNMPCIQGPGLICFQDKDIFHIDVFGDKHLSLS